MQTQKRWFPQDVPTALRETARRVEAVGERDLADQLRRLAREREVEIASREVAA